MDTLLQGLRQAVHLILSLDPEVLEIAGLSLRVSGTALAISVLLGVPLGAVLGLRRFTGWSFLRLMLYTGMGLPPVVVGLFVYILLSRSGPLGALNAALIPRLFTPAAMIVAQTLIIFPIVTGFTMAALLGVDPLLRQQLLSLGATPWQATMTLLVEARAGIAAAVAAGLGRALAEVGAVMMVGGNIAGETRVLTTAIVLETSKGNFDVAIALGLILLAMALVINFVILQLEERFFRPL
ncbi:MAG: ABC transporter permease [Anaerolineae bacterium]|nr:ABC transporter permease [Anaerolineae bacterium]